MNWETDFIKKTLMAFFGFDDSNRGDYSKLHTASVRIPQLGRVHVLNFRPNFSSNENIYEAI